MSRRHESVFDYPDGAAELAEKFVVVPANKASYRPLASYALPPQTGNFVDHVFLKAYNLASILQHVAVWQLGRNLVTACYIRYPYKICSTIGNH